MIVSRILVQSRAFIWDIKELTLPVSPCGVVETTQYHAILGYSNRYKLTFRGLLITTLHRFAFSFVRHWKRTNTNFDVLLLFLRTPFPFLGYFTCFVFSSSISSMISSSSVRSNVKLACKLREYAKATYLTQNAHEFA